VPDPAYPGADPFNAVSGYQLPEGSTYLITNILYGEAIDGDVEYDWQMPLAGTPFTGTIPTGVSVQPTNTYTTFRKLEVGTGTLTLTNVSIER